eukprot:12879880-Alexandrium_andersonii.AAC.1
MKPLPTSFPRHAAQTPMAREATGLFHARGQGRERRSWQGLFATFLQRYENDEGDPGDSSDL